MTLDDKDRKILQNLLVDARLSSRQLAHKLGMSTVTIISRLKKLEKENIILGYTARVNQEALGYDLTAVIEITTAHGKMIEIGKTIADYENVSAVYDITGTADTIVIAKFKNRTSLSEFVKKVSSLPHVENTVTHIVLNTIKEDQRFI
ncbi:MAG: Lrp/AsnC family transcriptional regulator [Nitrosopumilaceae archaeon]|nr:Lrp/AsnC family transcriptional regulator [Nitrosopumilaceae archaeon]